MFEWKIIEAGEYGLFVGTLRVAKIIEKHEGWWFNIADESVGLIPHENKDSPTGKARRAAAKMCTLRLRDSISHMTFVDPAGDD